MDYGEVLLEQTSANGTRVVVRPDLKAKCWALEFYTPNKKGKGPSKQLRWYPGLDQVLKAAGEMLARDLSNNSVLATLKELTAKVDSAVMAASKYAEGNRLLKGNKIGPATPL